MATAHAIRPLRCRVPPSIPPGVQRWLMRAVLGLSVRPTRNVWSIFRDGPKNDFAARLCPERWAECGGSGSAAGNFGRPSGPRWAAGHRTMFSSAGRLRNGAARAGAEGLRRHVLSVLMFSYVTDSGVWLYVPDSGGRSRHLVRVIPTPCSGDPDVSSGLFRHFVRVRGRESNFPFF